MRLRPTGLGLKGALFFATVLVLFLATPYSNLFFLMTAFLAVLGAVGTLSAWTNLRGLFGDVAVASQAPVGGSHEFGVRIGSSSRRRHHGVGVSVEVGGRRHELGTSTFVAEGTLVTGHVDGLPRGIHSVTAVVFDSLHPFGIVRASVRRALMGVELVTFPMPAVLGAGDPDDPLGDIGRLLAGNGNESVSSLRNFRDGDSLRDVHWKATARRGQPVVKERETSADSGLHVVLDRRTDAATLETMLSVIATLMLRAQETKQPLHLTSQDHDAVYAPGRRSTASGLRWLAGADLLPADAWAPPPSSPGAVRLPDALRAVGGRSAGAGGGAGG